MATPPQLSARAASLGLICTLVTVSVGSDGIPPLYTEVVTIPERGVVTGYVLWSKDYRLSFIPPAKWSIRYDADNSSATLLPPGLEAGISINVAPEPSQGPATDLALRVREGIRRRYPDAIFTGEFPCFAAGRQGWAIDFERRIESETIRVSFRRAVFEFDEGMVELELKASSAKFPEYHHAYGALLNSLRIAFPAGQGQMVATRTNHVPSSDRPGATSDTWSD